MAHSLLAAVILKKPMLQSLGKKFISISISPKFIEIISKILTLFILSINQRFKVGLVLKDNTNQTSVLIMGRTAEHLFNITCHHLVIEKGYTDKKLLPPDLLQVEGQTKIFQLRFGSMKKDYRNTDFVVQAVHEDHQQQIEDEAGSSKGTLTLPSEKQKETQIIPTSSIDSPQQFQAASLKIGATIPSKTPGRSSSISPKTPIHRISPFKKRSKSSVQRALYAALRQASMEKKELVYILYLIY